jgi:hypothetical protein
VDDVYLETLFSPSSTLDAPSGSSLHIDTFYRLLLLAIRLSTRIILCRISTSMSRASKAASKPAPGDKVFVGGSPEDRKVFIRDIIECIQLKGPKTSVKRAGWPASYTLAPVDAIRDS